MENAPDNLNATPQPPSARRGWWQNLFPKKEIEKEIPCGSCWAIKNSGPMAPWDIDCRFCDRKNIDTLVSHGSMVDLDTNSDLFKCWFSHYPYASAFLLLGFASLRNKAGRLIFKTDLKNQTIASFIDERGKSVELLSPPFSRWPYYLKAYEGILWFGKRPFVRLMKNGQIFQAKMSRWPKGHRETVVIDVAPEK